MTTLGEIEIEYKVVHRPDEARQMGWTKNHHAVEVFAVGKWRTMGYWTLKQLEGRVWELEVKQRLAINGGFDRSKIRLVKKA